MIKISPSILSSNFSNLEFEITKLEKSGADMIHIDVMDGNFVNNITIGPVVISSIRDKTKLPFDVHLMISEPDKYLDDFIKVGSDIITIHYESTYSNLRDTLMKIKSNGKMAGLAIKPNTKAEKVFDFIDLLDVVLVMTVEPGFGGQKFLPNMLNKINEVRKYINNSDKLIDIEVDGGINNITVKNVINNGANIIVAGSYIFESQNYKRQIDSLKNNY